MSSSGPPIAPDSSVKETPSFFATFSASRYHPGSFVRAAFGAAAATGSAAGAGAAAGSDADASDFCAADRDANCPTAGWTSWKSGTSVPAVRSPQKRPTTMRRR